MRADVQDRRLTLGKSRFHDGGYRSINTVIKTLAVRFKSKL